MLSCYLCPKECNGIEEYTHHLRNVHVLIEPCSVRCNADGCRRTFSTYNSLRRHVKKQHEQKYFSASSTYDSVFRQHNTRENVHDIDQERIMCECTPPVCAEVAPNVDHLGIAQAALKFLLSLLASNAISLATVNFIRNSTQELVKEILNFLKCKLMKIMADAGIDINSVPMFQELLDDFDGWANPFCGIETEQQLLSYLKKKGVYQEAEPNTIGKRWEVKKDRGSNKQMQVEVDDVFYYVPIENTLKLVLQQPQSWLLIDRRAEQADSGIVADWLHGCNGVQLKQYCADKFPLSIPVFIQVYFDEVETVNPIGSKTGIHKLGAFYFVIKNFPATANSSLHNIHLLALAHAADLKKYTADAVMRRIVSELKELHEVGFTVQSDSQVQHFRCFLTQIVGDNLGLHSILGFMENFSRAAHACDLCMASQDDMQTVFEESALQSRTPELYNQHILELASGKITASDCGVKRSSVLTSLPYYHPASNDAADVMHDLFEGVLPLETKLFVCHLVYEIKCLTLTDLNNRIKSADYGRLGSRSKPSVVLESHLKGTDAGLGQRSAQMILLFYWLPLIVGDVLQRVDPVKLQLLHLLRRIVEIVLMPILSDTHLLYLSDLIAEHHNLFKLCYPERRLLYKHHRMIHYSRIVRNSGPLLGMMVMRYEAKHNFAKRLAHVICNFKNISYSVCKRHQMAHALKWMTLSPMKGCAEVGTGEMVALADLQDSTFLLPFTGSGIDIFVANSVSMFGQDYFPGLTLLTDINQEGEPTFALIDRMYVHDDEVFFMLTEWLIYEFSFSLQAYSCTLSHDRSCLRAADIADYKPYTAVSCNKPGCPYMHIILRHHLCYDRIYTDRVSAFINVFTLSMIGFQHSM